MKKKTKIDVKLWHQLIAILVISIAIAFIVFVIPTQTISFSCDINGIEYVKLENDASCWDDRFHDDYCPMPERIHCSGFVRTSPFMLTALA